MELLGTLFLVRIWPDLNHLGIAAVLRMQGLTAIARFIFEKGLGNLQIFETKYLGGALAGYRIGHAGRGVGLTDKDFGF